MERSVTTDSSADGSLVTTIVEEVARREDVAVTALEPPLHESIDTEALEELFAPTARSSRDRGSGRIEFGYRGYDVVVGSDGRVLVEGEESSDDGRSRIGRR